MRPWIVWRWARASASRSSRLSSRSSSPSLATRRTLGRAMRDTRRSRIVLAILVLMSITLIVFDLRGGLTQPLRSVGETVLGSAERAMAGVVVPVRNLVDSLGDLGSADERIAALEQENAQLRAELDTAANDRARIEDLNALLGLVSTNEYTTVPAQVIAVGPAQGFAWTVTIDAGSRDGVERDMSVISGAGLVGRTIDVGPTTSTVLLIVDATSSVGGRLSGTSQIGIVSGTGRQDSLTMQLLDPLAVVDVGDVVVSFGSEGGRPYAPGIPIGVVAEMRGTEGQLTRSAILEPYVDISRLDIVGVVLRAPEGPPRSTLDPALTGVGGGG
ncbi:MAG: rod shape-determining protein MreC [Candidatus Nanopelagicales bacterium]